MLKSEINGRVMETRNLRIAGSGLVVVAAGMIALGASALMENIFAHEDENDVALVQEARKDFQPLPKDAAVRDDPVATHRVSLGRMLFFDPRISAPTGNGAFRAGDKSDRLISRESHQYIARELRRRTGAAARRFCPNTDHVQRSD